MAHRPDTSPPTDSPHTSPPNRKWRLPVTLVVGKSIRGVKGVLAICNGNVAEAPECWSVRLKAAYFIPSSELILVLNLTPKSPACKPAFGEMLAHSLVP